MSTVVLAVNCVMRFLRLKYNIIYVSLRMVLQYHDGQSLNLLIRTTELRVFDR